MREAAAWRQIGNAMSEHKNLGGGEGLCMQIAWLCDEGHISDATWKAAYMRVTAYCEGRAYGFAHGDFDARALAAYWLALEAEHTPEHG